MYKEEGCVHGRWRSWEKLGEGEGLSTLDCHRCCQSFAFIVRVVINVSVHPQTSSSNESFHTPLTPRLHRPMSYDLTPSSLDFIIQRIIIYPFYSSTSSPNELSSSPLISRLQHQSNYHLLIHPQTSIIVELLCTLLIRRLQHRSKTYSLGVLTDCQHVWPSHPGLNIHTGVYLM